MATQLATVLLPPPIPHSSSRSDGRDGEFAAGLRRTFSGIWHHADPDAGPGGRLFSRDEQARNEVRLGALVDTASRESRQARHDRTFGQAAQMRVLHAVREFACPALGWDPSLLEGPEADEFAAALRAFPTLARRFDPSLTPSDVYQAARNAITFHCLQRLLDRPVRPTPSCLAYSLLYPYTDNYLDDVSLDVEGKVGFGARLAGRLRGEHTSPASPHERRIFSLVEMIEGEYSRERHLNVFQSLLAIHAAQQRSLALLHATEPPSARDIIDITVDKGGASVLADGYLAAGSLTARQAECVYGLGVFLQLRDDLEDLASDRANHQWTVFSSAPGRQPLDAPTARTFAVGAAVVDRLDSFPSAVARHVRDLIRQSLSQTITDAAASCADRYSDGYRTRLEAHSPVRLASLVKQRQRLSRANGSLTTILEAWLDHAEPTAFAAVR